MCRREWLLKRNCSLSPRQLALAYAILVALSSAVAVGAFILHGVVQILLFSILEMAGAALAFLHYARHATDHEHISLMDGYIQVEQVLATHVLETRLDSTWARIISPHGHGLVRLEARGVKVEVGRFVTEERRRQFAKELQQELRKGFSTPPSYVPA